MGAKPGEHVPQHFFQGGGGGGGGGFFWNASAFVSPTFACNKVNLLCHQIHLFYFISRLKPIITNLRWTGGGGVIEHFWLMNLEDARQFGSKRNFIFSAPSPCPKKCFRATDGIPIAVAPHYYAFAPVFHFFGSERSVPSLRTCWL